MNKFNPTSEVQNIENGVFQNALFANDGFPNRDYSCLEKGTGEVFEERYKNDTSRLKNTLKFCLNKREVILAGK